jgi:hypothetical protein
MAFAAAGLPVLALWLFARSPGRALVVLTDLETGIGGTLGTMEVTAAILLCLACAVATPARSNPATSVSPGVNLVRAFG